MGKMARSFFVMALITGAAAFTYECLIDDNTREKVNDTVLTVVDQAQDLIGKATDAMHNVSFEDLQAMADNNAWVAKQWHDIGY